MLDGLSLLLLLAPAFSPVLPLIERHLRMLTATPAVSLDTAPICPCEITPRGRPGLLRIGEHHYAIVVLADLPPSGEPIVRGFRLVSGEGNVYDLCLEAYCDCPGASYGRLCKHTRAIRQLRREGRLP